VRTQSGQTGKLSQPAISFDHGNGFTIWATGLRIAICCEILQLLPAKKRRRNLHSLRTLLNRPNQMSQLLEPMLTCRLNQAI